MIAVLTPLQSEVAKALEALGGGRPVAAPEPGALFEVGEALVGWTGVGRRATEGALARVAELNPTRVLHLGVAGGLRHGLAAGDARLIVEAHREGADPLSLEPDADWAAAWGLPTGGCLTVRAIAETPADKAALARAHPRADVVEMETYWAAEAAQRLGLALTCVRVVSDRLDQTLPDLSSALDAAGRPRPLALARHLLTRPRTLARLPAVASGFNLAERRLRGLICAAARPA